MIGIFNSITIDNHEIYRGNDFTLSREFLYAGEVETCTGKRCADLVGWRYADTTIQWDALPDGQLQSILALSGEQVEFTFTNEEDESVTETVIPRALASTATRHTGRDGKAIWKGISLQIQFINAHNLEEE